MTLRDFLMRGEQIRFRSSRPVRFGAKSYHVILSDRRILLFARRGAFFKSDDIVSQKLDDLQGVKYSEQGIISRKGTIRVQGQKTEMDLTGPAIEIKTLYQQMMAYM